MDSMVDEFRRVATEFYYITGSGNVEYFENGTGPS